MGRVAASDCFLYSGPGMHSRETFMTRLELAARARRRTAQAGRRATGRSRRPCIIKMDRQQSHNILQAISKRAGQATEVFSSNNKRSWMIFSFGILYLLYRSARMTGGFEKSPDLKNMFSRIIFIAIILLIWLIVRRKERDVRHGFKMSELRQVAMSSLKTLARKARPERSSKAFRPNFRGGSSGQDILQNIRRDNHPRKAEAMRF
jgi:hypothetical protein